MDIAEHYRKTDVSGNSIVYYGRFPGFLRNGFRERWFYTSKTRWAVQYLEVC